MGTHHLAIITIAYVLLLYPKLSLEVVDFISQSQPIRDVDNVTLVSKRGAFELGFFTPANSNKRYLGIWYKNIPIQTIVWVANRDSPINDSTGILTLNSTGGNLVLAQNHTVVWSTTSVKTPKNPVVNLLDSGNLVVREDKEENPENYLWQSFDYPTDTSLPGMKFGWDLRTGLNRRRVAWKSPNDPSTGDFSLEMVLNNYPEAYIMKGTQKFYRAGPWNGLRPSGTPQIKDNPIYDYKSVSNKNEIYYMYELKNKSVISRQVLNITTQALQRFIWLEAEQVWRLFQAVPTDYCDSYGLCGGNGICTISGSPICQCLKGFSPKSPQKWNSIDWSNGCVRNKNLSCMDDGFVRMSNVKLPDTAHSWLDETMTLEECRNKCFNNCSCMAYTNSDIRGQGSGCAMWFGNLIDIRNFSDGGQDLYVRMAASELANPGGAKGNNIKRKGIVIAATISTISVMLFTFLCIYKKSRKSRVKTDRTLSIENIEEDTLQEDMELPFYNFDIIARATNNFSIDNKLGQGGFGSVYKGVLVDGQEIAVKRLSQNSQQGTKEFKNEVILCAKLQHRNLVKVLGCCIQREEKMLIYEYMQNKSLDSFIFGPSQSKLLDWSKCFHIICGIARGLMYLHQDSTLRIIHRDLKASNILLDNELNPKISDFGLARIFGSDQIEENTRRVVGTYGYMAPEYASHGLFSIKSDVFSFGILILEIVSGKKNRGFSFASQSQNLIGHVWRLWKENIPLKLIDAHLEGSCIKSEVLRCIHVGLLCVQHHPNDRPNMASVVVMLTSEVDLAQPKEPGFLLENMPINSESSTSNHMPASNRISTTEIEPR